MAHAIQQVVTAVAGAVTGLATTASRVYQDRPDERELQETEVPGLLVYDDGDEAEEWGANDGVVVYRRVVRLTVEAKAKEATFPTTLRQIASEVETALGVHLSVSGKLLHPFYRGCDTSPRSGESDRPVGARRMRFEVEIFTAANAPDVLL